MTTATQHPLALITGVGPGVGALDTDAQGVQGGQRIAQMLHPVLRAHQADFKHSHANQRLR